MMNKLASRTIGYSIASVAGAFMLAGTVNADSFPAHIEEDLVKICKAIQENDTLDLHRAVKNSRISYRSLEEGLVCNGQDMMAFAVTHNADKAGAFLARKVDSDARTMTAKR